MHTEILKAVKNMIPPSKEFYVICWIGEISVICLTSWVYTYINGFDLLSFIWQNGYLSIDLYSFKSEVPYELSSQKQKGNCQNPLLEMDAEDYMVSSIVFPDTPFTVWKIVRILVINDYSKNVG